MNQNLLNKLWLRICMIVAVTTTALAGTAWAETTYALQQVTSVEAGGMYVFEQGGHVMNNTCSNNALQTTATYKTSGLTGTETYVWTLETATGGFYMKNVNGTGSYPYLNNASSKTNVSFEVNESSIWAFDFQSDNTVLIQNTSNSNRFLGYTTATSYAYKAYATSNLSSYPHAIKVYQLVEEGGSSSAVATSVVISDKTITNTDVYVSDEAGSLSATVVAGEATLSGATVTWSGNNDAVATIDASTGAVTLVGAGVVTFTAAYAGVSGEYNPSSATYEMTVTDSTPFTGGDVTFDATADKGNTSAGEGSIVKNGVTFYCSNGILGNGSEYRFYKNAEVAFTLPANAIASGYVIKSVAFTCTSGNPASGFATQDGWTTEGSNGTWTGAAASVSFTASGAQVRATEIVVTVGQQAALASIEVSGDYPTSFHAGDAFSHEGIVVTATYDDSTTRDVTALATFSEPDMTSVGIKTVTVSYSEGEVTETTTYEIAVNAPATLVSISLSGTYPTEFGQGDAFSSEGIVVTANYDDNTTADVTAEATFSGYDMNALGEQTVTVSYEGKEATYTINVVEKLGTETNPYTVAQARAAIDAGTGTQGVYATGIVSKIVTAFNSQHGNISYNISADGTEAADQLQAYRGKSYNGDNFTSADDIQVGDTVVVYGNLTKYNSTYEFAQDNQLVSLVRPVNTTPSINLGENEINAFAEGTDGVIIVGYENITTVVADVFFCDANGNAATYDWLTASINSINNLEYIIDANTSTDARTAYMKVHALDDDANDVYSELITINQEGYVAPATPGKWVETTLASLTSSDVFVIVGDNGENNYALSNDKGASSAPTAVKVDVEGNTLKSGPENNVKWTIDFTEKGFVFYPYGSTETWLYCTNANNGVRVGTNDNKEFTTEEGYLKNIETSRFVGVYISQDWRCYTINTGNIANQTFKFYKRIDADKVQTISVTDAGYATLVAKEDLEVPAGIEVFAVQVKGIYAHLEPVTAGVPAGEAVIVKAVAEGNYSLPYAEDAVNAINGNELKASDEPIEADGTQYILAKPENEEVGFYPAATGTTIAAGKAYLQITGTAPVKGFTFSFDDDATGINEELRMKNEDSDLIFNLAGQRIQKMQKGINIINGKKVLF